MPWGERSNKLVAYKAKNDNCNVARSQGALGTWVNAQRQFHTKGKLSQEHSTKLEGIRFNWVARKQKEHMP